MKLLLGSFQEDLKKMSQHEINLDEDITSSVRNNVDYGDFGLNLDDFKIFTPFTNLKKSISKILKS